MKYKIKAFGITKDIIGKREILFELNSGVRVSDLMEELHKQYPDLKALNSLFIAVNNEYAEGEKTLREQDEIALIPPVSGG